MHFRLHNRGHMDHKQIFALPASVGLYSHTHLLVDEHMAVGGVSVPPGTPNLLHKRLKTLGHVVVDDGSHVSLVQTHPKGDRGHHYTHGTRHELILHASSLSRRHPSVVALRKHCHLPRVGFGTLSSTLRVREGGICGISHLWFLGFFPELEVCPQHLSYCLDSLLPSAVYDDGLEVGKWLSTQQFQQCLKRIEVKN